MGVPKLSAFLREYCKKCFTVGHIIPPDSKIVIDGLNLCHNLYHKTTDYLHGGDYDSYAKVVREHFNNWTACKVEPFVVLDGAREISHVKDETLKIRAEERLKTAYTISKGDFSEGKILPALAIQTFIDVLKELKITHAQGEFEADPHIIAVAKKINCPVLSSDNDFLLYDLPAGVINIDSVKFMSPGNGHTKYVKCTIFDVRKVDLTFQGIKTEVLPLFGTLLGNDYINMNVFDPFFDHVQKLKQKHVLLKQKLNIHVYRKIAYLVWLTEHSLQSAQNFIMTFLGEEDRNLFSKIVNDFSNLTSFMTSYFEEKDISCLAFSGLRNIPEINPSPEEWFLEEFHSCNLPAFLVNILLHKKIVFKSQVENFEKPSVNECSLEIRKAVYSIMLGLRKGSGVIAEYDRNTNGDKMIRKEINVGKTPIEGGYNNIFRLDTEMRRQTFLRSLYCNDSFLSKYPTKWYLFLACLIFVGKQRKPGLTEEFLSAILVSALIRSPRDASGFVENSSVVDDNDITAAEIKANGVSESPQSSKLLVRIVHSYSQVQSCLLFASHLNSLLLKPVHALEVHKLCNGSFIYNLTLDLETRRNSDDYISELLGRGSTMHDLYCRLKGHLMKDIGKDNLVKVEKKKRKRSANISKAIK